MPQAAPPEDLVVDLFPDDPLTRRLPAAVRGERGVAIAWRITAFIALAWMGTVVLALLESEGGDALQSLWHDPVLHVRLLLAGPLLLAAVPAARARSAAGMRYLVESGIVQEGERARLTSILERARRASDSWPLLIGVFVAALLLSFVEFYARGQPRAPWMLTTADGEGATLSLAGAWYLLVANMLFRLVMLRWVWLLIAWAVIMWRVGALRLDLNPLHADGAGGLEEFGRIPAGFAAVVFAISSSLAAALADEVLHRGASVVALRPAIVGLTLLVPAIVLAPTLALMPALLRARKEARATYALIFARHARRVAERWSAIDATGRSDEGLETSQQADALPAYRVITHMRPVPIARETVVTLLLASAVPMLVVVCIEVPFTEIVKRLAGLL